MAIETCRDDEQDPSAMTTMSSVRGRRGGRSLLVCRMELVDRRVPLCRHHRRTHRPPPVAPLPVAAAEVHLGAVVVDGYSQVAAVAAVVDGVLPDAPHPAHWTVVAVDPALRERYQAIRRAIDNSASSPFRAGSLQRDDVRLTLRRRAPHLRDHDLPLPLPLTLDSVLALDLAALRSPIRSGGSSATLADVRKAFDCGDLVDADGPLTHWAPMFYDILIVRDPDLVHVEGAG